MNVKNSFKRSKKRSSLLNLSFSCVRVKKKRSYTLENEEFCDDLYGFSNIFKSQECLKISKIF